MTTRKRYQQSSTKENLTFLVVETHCTIKPNKLKFGTYAFDPWIVIL